jgi:hypothetical protein
MTIFTSLEARHEFGKLRLTRAKNKPPQVVPTEWDRSPRGASSAAAITIQFSAVSG